MGRIAKSDHCHYFYSVTLNARILRETQSATSSKFLTSSNGLGLKAPGVKEPQKYFNTPNAEFLERLKVQSEPFLSPTISLVLPSSCGFSHGAVLGKSGSMSEVLNKSFLYF